MYLRQIQWKRKQLQGKMADHKNARSGRGKSSPYWKTGPGSGAMVEGLKTQEELDSWAPAIAHVSPRRRREEVIRLGGFLGIVIL